MSPTKYSAALFLLLFSTAASALAEEPAKLALPWPVQLENTATSFRVIGPTEFELSAPPKTDLYVSPDGNSRVNLSPRLLFRPDGPFILTAKIQPDHQVKWDAGVLLLFNDPEHFAKFCFELDYRGVPRVVSVVCNGTGDDCNSDVVPGGAVWYRVVGSVPGDTFTFYTSPDGRTWTVLRTFRLAKTDALRAGFGAQSPAGVGCRVRFTDIRVERRAVRDFWAGD